MSTIAAEKLVSLGYTNIWNLTGGMVEWEQAGYSIENK
jgi:rhodanese-related sulfurtransferase